MANRATRRRNRSRGVIVSGLTLAAMLAATRPMLPAKVYATDIAYDWVRQNENLDLNGGWYSKVAMSADGSVMLSAVVDGDDDDEESPLYISRNYGTTWENIAPDIDPGVSHEWEGLDVSNDGQVIVVASDESTYYDTEEFDYGNILISEDGGDNWTNITPEGEGYIRNWRHIAVSGDGSTVAALSFDDSDNVFISENGGDTWETSAVEDFHRWYSISISDDGNTILIGGEADGDLAPAVAISENGGDSWEAISPNNEDLAFGGQTVMSSNGDKIAVVVDVWGGSDEFSEVYISENSGADWTDITPEKGDEIYWNALAMSGDGSVLSVASEDTSYLHFSQNDGADWDTVHPGLEYSDETIEWYSADFSADGSRFIGSGGEEVYTAYSESENGEIPVVNFGNAEDGKTVVLTLPSGTTVTCQSAVKESGLSAQDAGYQYPVGLVDFCFSTEDEENEVSLLFVTDLKPDQVIARKYNPNTETYATVDNVSITESTHNGQPALLVTYTIVDNGPLDLDPDDGEIADPIGLASTVGAPNTGLQSIRDFLFRK